jgi:hypothetical protein
VVLTFPPFEALETEEPMWSAIGGNWLNDGVCLIESVGDIVPSPPETVTIISEFVPFENSGVLESSKRVRPQLRKYQFEQIPQDALISFAVFRSQLPSSVEFEESLNVQFH